jgi:hypothetical protein
MKLLKILKESILLSERLSKKYRIFPNINKDGVNASVYQSEHQKLHRNGDLEENNIVLTKIADGEWRTGANSRTIRKQIYRNLEKIIKEFSEFDEIKNKRILFIDKFKNPNFPDEDSTYLEYVLEANKKNDKNWEFEIISSAHSLDGKYLRSHKNDKVSNLVENYIYVFDKIILLY